MRTSPKKTYTFRLRAEVEKFWHEVRDVPARSGRQKRSEERYALGLFLRARSDNALINFPVEVVELTGNREPDFSVAEAGHAPVSLEVTRATTWELQRQMDKAERKAEERLGASARRGTRFELVEIPLLLNGSAGNDYHPQWLGLIEGSIEKKLAKLDSYCRATGLTRHDLLIYDDTPILGVDRSKVLPALARWVHDKRKRNPLLGIVSLIMSLDVVYDIDRQCRTLRFLDLGAPDHFSGFGDRVEYAAQKAVRDELNRSRSR